MRHYGSLDEAGATRQRCVESDNLVAACRRALARGDAPAAARVLLPAWAAMRLVGPFSTGVELAGAVIGLGVGDAAVTTAAHWVRGSARHLLGETAAAREDLEAALTLSQSQAALRCRIMCSLAEVESTFGDAVRSAALFTDALHLARTLHDTARQCQALNGLGTLAATQSRLAEAIDWYQQALAVARSTRERRWEGGLLGNLGTVLHAQGDLAATRRCYEQALACAREIGDRHFEGNTRCNLGLLLLEMGEADEALTHFDAALESARSLGHSMLAGTVLCNMGLLNEAEGKHDAALALHRSAVEAAARSGDRRTEGQFRVYLGRLLARTGDIAGARACLGAAEALLSEARDAISIAMLQCAHAETDHLAGDAAAARAQLVLARQPYEGSRAEPTSELGRELARVDALCAESQINRRG